MRAPLFFLKRVDIDINQSLTPSSLEKTFDVLPFLKVIKGNHGIFWMCQVKGMGPFIGSVVLVIGNSFDFN